MLSEPQVRDALPVHRATGRQWAALGVLTLAVVLLAVDATVLSLAVPALTADLDPTSTQLLWIGDIYSFALAGLLLTMGTLADRIGRKRLLMVGSAAFGLASLLAAFAPTAEALIAGRTLLGVAGATLMPSTLAIIRNIFVDPRQRTTAITIWTAGATGGAALGPLVGGVLLEHFWWGSVFTINVPVMILLIAGGIVLIPESRDPAPGRFDLISAALSLLTIVPLVYAVKEGATHGLDGTVAAAAAIGLASGVVFVRRQRQLEQPLLDLSLFANPAFSGAIAANMLAIAAFSGMIFFFSQYLQLVRGIGPLAAGLAEMPLTIAAIAVIGIAVTAVDRLGAGRTLGLSLAVAAVGLLLLGLAEGLGSYAWLVVPLVVVGLGIGLAFAVTTDAVLAAAPANRAGAASAISETGYELGVALGIALLGTLQMVLYRHLLVFPAGISDQVRTSASESLASAVRDTSVAAAAKDAFAHALQVTSYSSAALLLVAAVVAWRVIPSTPAADAR